jgi:hypothetical protein
MALLGDLISQDLLTKVGRTIQEAKIMLEALKQQSTKAPKHMFSFFVLPIWQWGQRPGERWLTATGPPQELE